MKRAQVVTVLLLIVVSLCLLSRARVGLWRAISRHPISAEDAFERKLSGVFIEIEGKVIEILAEDYRPPRHQRFIVELASGQTILVAHNIDLAPSVQLEKGALIKARGEYEWNGEGGMIHWTHRDPKGRKRRGWIRLTRKRRSL